MRTIFSAGTPAFKLALVLLSGIAIGSAASRGLAEMAAPSEHKGLSVDKLGVIDEAGLKAQTGLTGYFMQLRAITIAPGGQIASHSHEKRPGLVKVIGGTWVEGRPSGETEYPDTQNAAILEDKDTVHWFWNRGNEPATAIVCDLTPTG